MYDSYSTSISVAVATDSEQFCSAGNRRPPFESIPKPVLRSNESAYCDLVSWSLGSGRLFGCEGRGLHTIAEECVLRGASKRTLLRPAVTRHMPSASASYSVICILFQSTRRVGMARSNGDTEWPKGERHPRSDATLHT